MELFKNLFTNHGIPLFVISTFSTWLLGIVIVAMVSVIYWFFKSGVTASESKNDALTRQVALLLQQIDYASRQEIKARAEAEKATAARDKLLSSLSHEIRTPMNGILGMTLLLEETTLTPEQRDYIDTITNSGKILLNRVNEVMVTDVLDHAKINVLSAGPELKTIDLRTTIEEVLDIFAVKASENKIELLYELAADAPRQINADDKRMRQVLINLVENIIETTSQQQVFIGVHALKNDAQKNVAIVFEVGDKRLEDVLTLKEQLNNDNIVPEYKGDDSRTKDLELAIAKKLVDEMNGQIRTAGALNENFIFSIPFVAATDISTGNTVFTMKGFEGRNVLVVNNNITASGILKNRLAQWKLKPAVAFSGSRALEMMAKDQYDIVITDMDMEEINGIDLAKSIRENYPDIPVVLLNPVNDERYKQHEEIFGEISVISKPVRQHVLFDNILTALRHKKTGGVAQEISVKTLSTDFSKQYPLRILIAEDNPVNQKWATKILNKMGYQPDIAENGHVVLDMVDQATYDLILMDVQMPKMDGMEATKMIRVCLDKQPVVIAMTANVMQGDRHACMKAGMDDYISKPVELVELVNMLEKWGLVIKERKLQVQ
jgi:CheY-like chemotaxis protein/signal transduction histidine kinase